MRGALSLLVVLLSTALGQGATIAIPESALSPLDKGAAANTKTIQNAIDGAGDSDVVLIPAGTFPVETITVRKKTQFSLRGAAVKKTVLRRLPMRWDNNTQGRCPGIGILFVEEMAGFELTDITFDGNAPYMQIQGPGRFHPDDTIRDGTPQFPDCEPRGTGASAVVIERSTDVNVHDAEFRDGFRWCVLIGQVKGLKFVGNQITTGRLYGNWKGHRDTLGGLLHCHQSQDGLHLVNVVDATIQWNTIRSEDSGIAIEANPAWDWYTFPGESAPNVGTCDVRILNNDISTNSKAQQKELIKGPGLANEWVGQGCVDIFYNERWDLEGKVLRAGPSALIRDVAVSGNRLTQARHGVRAGIFRNANEHDAASPAHRVQGLIIEGNIPSALAGHNRKAKGGISKITKDTCHPNVAVRHGGVAILVHHADDVQIRNNFISDVSGGTGVELVDVTAFRIVGNRIQDIRGTKLADQVSWDGGEGIRVWNAPSRPTYDAKGFEITGNQIENTASYSIFITDTGYGSCPRGGNRTSRWVPWQASPEQRAIYLRECTGVRE